MATVMVDESNDDLLDSQTIREIRAKTEFVEGSRGTAFRSEDVEHFRSVDLNWDDLI